MIHFYRFLMFVMVGIPMMFYSAHVFGQYMWPAFVHPLAPTLFLEKLDISTALGFAIVSAWFHTGLLRAVMEHGTQPEERMSESERLSKDACNYFISAILISVFWGVTVLFF